MRGFELIIQFLVPNRCLNCIGVEGSTSYSDIVVVGGGATIALSQANLYCPSKPGSDPTQILQAYQTMQR